MYPQLHEKSCPVQRYSNKNAFYFTSKTWSASVCKNLQEPQNKYSIQEYVTGCWAPIRGYISKSQLCKQTSRHFIIFLFAQIVSFISILCARVLLREEKLARIVITQQPPGWHHVPVPAFSIQDFSASACCPIAVTVNVLRLKYLLDQESLGQKP